jgi:hypothetical protein
MLRPPFLFESMTTCHESRQWAPKNEEAAPCHKYLFCGFLNGFDDPIG